MEKIEKAKADDLGVKVSGSARTGHKIELAQDSALCRIFGTSDKSPSKPLPEAPESGRGQRRAPRQ